MAPCLPTRLWLCTFLTANCDGHLQILPVPMPLTCVVPVVSSLSQTLPALVLSPNLKTVSHYSATLTTPRAWPSGPQKLSPAPCQAVHRLALSSLGNHRLNWLPSQWRVLAMWLATWAEDLLIALLPSTFPSWTLEPNPIWVTWALETCCFEVTYKLGNPVLPDHRHCAYLMSVLP